MYIIFTVTTLTINDTTHSGQYKLPFHCSIHKAFNANKFKRFIFFLEFIDNCHVPSSSDASVVFCRHR